MVPYIILDVKTIQKFMLIINRKGEKNYFRFKKLERKYTFMNFYVQSENYT